MSFNTVDLNAINKAVNATDVPVEKTGFGLESRYPMMVYPNGMFDVSKMRGMYVTTAWVDNKRDMYSVYIVFEDGSDWRISDMYPTADMAKAELARYIKELWDIAEDFEKQITNFLR